MGKVGSLRLCKSKGATQHNTDVRLLVPSSKRRRVYMSVDGGAFRALVLARCRRFWFALWSVLRSFGLYLGNRYRQAQYRGVERGAFDGVCRVRSALINNQV